MALNKTLYISTGGSREGEQGVQTPPPPMKNHKNIGFLSNTSHIEQNGEVISSVIHDDHHLLEDNENHSNDEDNHSEENHIHVEINDEDLHDRKYLEIDDDDIVFRHSTSSENIIAA